MIRHLFKLVWNRKRANALIVAEIFISFLVVFAVLTGVITVATNWWRPLGFEWRGVWNVRVDIELESNPHLDPNVRAAMMRLMDETRSFPEVTAVAGTNTVPYSFSTMSSSAPVNGKQVELIVDEVTDDFAKVMGIEVLRGRWFNAEDDAATYPRVVIDENTAKALFGDEDPVGKKLEYGGVGEGVAGDPSPQEIVGVVGSYRKDGEVQSPVNMVFRRYGRNDRFPGIVRNLVLRVRPGTPASFEQVLVNRLQRVAPQWSFRVRHMDQMRTESLRKQLAPLVLGGVVGLFLISMVGLGLTGVLWQSVTRRTREIGLRRAMGASGRHVNRQILLEVLLLATIALFVGTILVLQLPILGAFSIVTPSAFGAAFFVALATIYTLTVLCGLYPSWLASRLQPADALRYE